METVVMLAVGTVVTMLIQMIEKKYNVSSRIIMLAFAILIAVGYQIFTEFVPEAVQASVVQFVTGSLGTAVFVYEYFVRIVVKKEYPELKKKE